jgi:hypothetical protein
MPPSATPQMVYCINLPSPFGQTEPLTGRSPGSQVDVDTNDIGASPSREVRARCFQRHVAFPVAGFLEENSLRKTVTHLHSLTVAGAAGELQQNTAHPVPISSNQLALIRNLSLQLQLNTRRRDDDASSFSDGSRHWLLISFRVSRRSFPRRSDTYGPTRVGCVQLPLTEGRFNADRRQENAAA